MNLSDFIQIVIGVITGIGVLSSIIISVKTLKQNNKMIEESSRPNIIIYKDVFNFNSPCEYLVIKNFGNSSAKITNIKFDREALIKISTNNIHTCDKAFEYLRNSIFAPNQNYKIPIKTADKGVENLTFVVEYSNIKHYIETINVNLTQDYGVSYNQQYCTDKELRDICNAIQENTKRLS